MSICTNSNTPLITEQKAPTHLLCALEMVKSRFMQPFQTNWDLNLGFGFGLVVRSSIIGLATGGLSNRVGDRLELEEIYLIGIVLRLQSSM